MQTLGKYQLIAEIARGGMGIVYLAVASGPGGFSKLFVIKELKPELVEDTGFFDMFLEEARLAARLSHPNIVTTYEVGVDGKRPFIVMDYLDGESLGRIMRKKSPKFTLAMQLRVLCHALDGLEYAHHLTNFDETIASVVHRDMSPQNVFITFDGQVKIVDFGIAKASDTSIETQAGIFKGKPGYMAPEQLSGDVDIRADLFSVGVMMWEAIAGRRMWPKKGQIEILTALIKGEIPTLDEVKADAPAELKRIVSKATAKNADDRYANAAEMRGDIEAYLEAQHERVTVREIAQVVGSMFDEQRKQMRALIEKYIQAAKDGAPPSKLPSLAPPPLEPSTPRPIEHTLQMASGTASVPAPAGLGSVREISVVDTMTGTPASMGTPDGSAFSIAHADAERARFEKRRRGVLLLVALGLIAASIVATILVLGAYGGNTQPPATAATAPPPAMSIAVSPAAAASTAAAPESPADAASAKAAAVASASASAAAALANAAAAPVKTRIVYVPAPPPPRPVPAAPAPAPALPAAEKASSSKADCNPPFYFEGTKKVFKPGCL